MLLRKLTERQHWVLLSLYLSIGFDKAEYDQELLDLEKMTLLGYKEGKYYINSRGKAFLNQQRDPHPDIDVILKHTSRSFQERLFNSLKSVLEYKDFFNAMVSKNRKTVSERSPNQPT